MACWVGRTGLATVATLATALLAGVEPGSAQGSQLDRIINNRLEQNRTGVDLRIIESRQRRYDYQEQQQRFREQDRVGAGQPRPRLDVPRMKRSCQTPLNGSDSIRGSCR